MKDDKQREKVVAPARERGLKFDARAAQQWDNAGRSREGAWIEITIIRSAVAAAISRSREGAWIEIGGVEFIATEDKGRSREGAWIEIAPSTSDNGVGAGRSREGAWIEISPACSLPLTDGVAPARERGLKCPGTFVV